MRRRFAALSFVVILAVAIVPYVAFTEYQNYNSPIARCERDSAAGDSGVVRIFVIPSLTVEHGTRTGNLTVKIDGSGCVPVVNFVITFFHPFLGGVVNASFVKYQGIVVGPAHPEPVDQPAAGSILLYNVTAGQMYMFGYRITTQTDNPGFANPSGVITFTAQS